MIAFGDYEALTFDCYGTLIDWERGILEAVDSVFGGRAAVPPDRESVLEAFARLESAAEGGAFRKYRAVLAEVARGLALELGLEASEEEAGAFAASVGSWPPFPDSPAALRRLAERYRLAVVSNVDDDLFAGSAGVLGVRFEQVVTAEQVRSYKPAAAHFHEVLRRLALPAGRVLHVAQSLYHDVAPAHALGIATVWVNRRAGRSGGGATPPSEARPDLEVPDLATLADRADAHAG